MSDETQTEEKRREEFFKEALKIRQFEIEMLWKRTGFYWLLIAAAFAGYGVLRKDG